MKFIGLFIALAWLALITAQVNAQASPTYQQQIDTWYAKRYQSLKANNGWLNLVGLYWLAEGKNSFGSGSQNAVVFPKGSIGAQAGYFLRAGNTVKLVPADTGINVNGTPTASNGAVLYQEGLQGTPVASYGSLRWVIIKRDDKIGVRLRDINSPLAANFTGTQRFAVDSTWRVTATLQTQQQPADIFITNILGQTSQLKSPGRLVFTLHGGQYALDALEEGDELFIVFGDATSGKTTYPSGRFLYAAKPGSDGTTVLDFNKAFNPPCAFTPYATCPLPPKQNILPVEITAGEKDYGNHH